MVYILIICYGTQFLKGKMFWETCQNNICAGYILQMWRSLTWCWDAPLHSRWNFWSSLHQYMVRCNSWPRCFHSTIHWKDSTPCLRSATTHFRPHRIQTSTIHADSWKASKTWLWERMQQCRFLNFLANKSTTWKLSPKKLTTQSTTPLMRY